MDRSSMRYAAVACVVAGGLMVSGTGGVALAKPDGPGRPGSDGPGTPGKPDPNPPGRGGSHGSGHKPKLNLPSLGPVKLPAIDTLPQSGPISLPNLGSSLAPITSPVVNSLPKLPIPTLPAGIAEAAGAVQLDALAPPLLQQVNVVPPVAPAPISQIPAPPVGQAGPPVVINNPLPESLPLDLQQPILPQALPPAVEAVSQQIPLVDFVMSPLLDAVVAPSLLSDIIVPTLLSDIVVPTVSLGGLLPGIPVSAVPTLSNLAASLLSPSVAPPTDLSPTGMDLLGAPLISPAPPPSAPPVDSPQQPPLPALPPKGDVAQLSEPVAYRAGYSDYLRNAGMAQITSIALPGVVGILLVTLGGGFIGYRQARAGHIIRADGIARFLR